uniref:tryptophan--tRNA ligase n=1 Tax=Syphacia muris TaxID=451379 RepID=A0A0N5ALT1_9BILA
MDKKFFNCTRVLRNALFSRSVTSDANRHPAVYFSGIQPTGIPHLGNYFGFIKPWLAIQEKESGVSNLYLSIADYHSLSCGPLDAAQIKRRILSMTASLLACGINPKRTCLFQQSAVAEHTNLMFILGMLQTVPQLTRQAQFKEKSMKFRDGSVPLNLLIYPVLQAADILLYKATHVPVGEDQTQHLRLSRDIAHLFNSFYKVDYFPIPKQVTMKSKRVKSLRNPHKKMSKSDPSSLSRIDLTDSKEDIFTKCSKALSDFQSNITYNVDERPGIANLIAIYCALNAKSPAEVVRECAGLDTKGFKYKLAEELDKELSPIRQRYDELMVNEKYIIDVLDEGSEKARRTAMYIFDEIKSIVGLRF